MQIKYLHFYVEIDQLQAELTKYGDEGWRLHTCDPVLPTGANGSGTLHAFVVMDMQIFDEEVPTPEPERGAIRMRG